MIQRLKPKSEFSRNVLTLMTGTTIAQAIPIAITPILTRLYSPEDFGVLALFVAVTSILGSVANGRYELAIMLPEDDEGAINLAALGVLIASIFSLLLFIPAIFLNAQITDLLGNQAISFWLYLVPIVVWLVGLYNVLNYLNIRKKLYKDIARATIYKSTAMATVQLAYGFIKASASGLIWGQIAANVAANAKLAKNAIQHYELKTVHWSALKRIGKRYLDFPIYSMWAILANTLATHLVNIMISLYYTVATLGFYSLAQKILGMPSALIGNSIGQVYFQQATKEKQATGKAIKTFDATAKKLLIVSLVFFTPLYFILPDVFSFAFGNEWRVAGEYGQIVLPLFVIRFIAAALSNTNNIFEKQRIALLWQLMLLFLSVMVILVSVWLSIDFREYLKIYVIVILIHYLLLFFILRKVSQGNL